MEDNTTKHYQAFLSYSHDDEEFGAWLHKKLEKYKIPKKLRESYPNLPKSLYPIFRDRYELNAGDDLGIEIPKALKNSNALIVICSPKSAKSKWVNKEIREFKALYGEDKIFPIIVDGVPFAKESDKFDDELECFPEALKYKVDNNGNLTNEKTDKLASDFNKNEDGEELAKLKLIAGLLGVPFGEFYRRDEEQKRKDRNRLFVIWSIVFLVIIGFAIFSWIQRTKAIENREKMSQAIFETSAIYAQFLLTSQNDYSKWSKATSKIIDTLNKKDIQKSIKVNDILAHYISIKGYKHEKGVDILPFYESPKYFLKTLFFRNTKYTTGYIEDRYISLFLLDNLEFSAKLFLFLSHPPIKLPKIYWRMQKAISSDLQRYGYFLEAIYYESKNKHNKALESIDKASKLGFFHSLTGNMSVFYLDSNYYFLYILDDKSFSEEVDKNHRLMTKKEKENLIKHINIYYLLSIYYSQENQKYLKMRYFSNNEVLLFQSIQEENYGKISYKNIVDYIINKLHIGKNKELEKFVQSLQTITLTKKEILEQKKYILSQEKLNQEYKKEILNALKESNSSKQDSVKKLVNKINKLNSKKFTDRFLKFIYYSTKDLREIDTLISKLSKKSINQIKKDFNIPKNINSAKEIRIYISKQIRPYIFDLAMYYRFITDKRVFKILNDIYSKEPENLDVKFSLKEYWKIKGNNKKANEYKFSSKNIFFKRLENILEKYKKDTRK